MVIFDQRGTAASQGSVCHHLDALNCKCHVFTVKKTFCQAVLIERVRSCNHRINANRQGCLAHQFLICSDGAAADTGIMNTGNAISRQGI